MAKVLFPAYFPFNTAYPSCNNLTNWMGLTLEQAMAAYWKVRSWSISINAADAGGASGSLSVSSPSSGVPAIIETDLVCVSANRSTNLSVSGDATDGDFFIGYSGFGFNLNFGEFPPLYMASTPVDSFPVYISGISDLTITLAGSGDDGSFGGLVSATISATSYWPYEE